MTERLVDVSAAEGGIEPEALADVSEWDGIDDATSDRVALVLVFESIADRDELLRQLPGLDVSRPVARWAPAALTLDCGDTRDPGWARRPGRDKAAAIVGSDELRAWSGLPRFEATGDRISLPIEFDSEADRDSLVAELGLRIAKKTRGTLSCWWPPRDREDLSSLRFESAANVLPRYPVYIPTKGRWQSDRALTIATLIRDRVPFRVVVEPQERDQYAAVVGAGRVLVLPFSNLGRGSIPARNWIKDHAIKAGAARHWIIDDNIIEFRRIWKGRRIPCHAGTALRVCEDLTDRYGNVAISGLNYQMFVPAETSVPFYRNVHVYSSILFSSSVPFRWRGRYNEDTDLCLQALDSGQCTLLVNAFMCNKLRTMAMGGGNTDELYADNGRLAMARSLEAAWPGTVTTRWKFGRPQHSVRWDRFETPLQLRPDADPDAEPNEYGLRLEAVTAVKSPTLRELLWDWHRAGPGVPA